jgi:hypothetical protein
MLNALIHCYLYCKATGTKVSDLPKNLRMLVQGDDNALVGKKKVDYKKGMKRLGFKAETKHRANLYDVSFCSARFVPVVNGSLLLPIIPRVVNKFGTFPTNKLIPYEDMCSTAAKGMYNTLSFIPSLKQWLDKIIQKSPEAEVAQLKQQEWQVWCARPVDPSPETWVWLDKYYLGFPDVIKEDNIQMDRFLELGTDAPTLFYTGLDPVLEYQSDGNGLISPSL